VKYSLPLLILVLSLSAFGQRSIADLQPQHREALKNYLKTRTSMSLRLESVVDREYLASMIEFLGAGLKPNYAVGDFNGDRRTDFAVLLTRPGKPRNFPAGEEARSSEHFPDYPLHLVVFNGAPGSAFKPAFSMNFSVRMRRSYSSTKSRSGFITASTKLTTCFRYCLAARDTA